MYTKVTIKKYYIIFTIVNLILSIIALIISKKFTSLWSINLGYHMMYYFIGYLPRYQLKWIRLNSKICRIVYKIEKIFADLVVLAGIVFMILVTNEVIQNKDYIRSLSLCMPIGIILGGFLLKNYLQEIKNEVF